MKFKKDGKVFESADEALDNAFDCSDCENAAGCPVGREGMMHGVDCCTYVEAYPAEAARLMGYEVVEDNYLESDAVEKETHMDKQKPRICEVLGVEVGEKFKVKNDPRNAQLWYEVLPGGVVKGHSDVGAWDYVGNDILYAINYPESIIRKPRFTEAEVERAKAARVLWPHAICVKKETGAVMLYGEDGEAIAGIDTGAFPSILPGQSVKLSDIVGGDTE